MKMIAARTGTRRDRELAVVIPCYEAEGTIGSVLSTIGPEVDAVYCVDDGSTDSTSEIIDACAQHDPRIHLIRRPANGGVGAATIDGYRAALADHCSVLVKIDADGQMDPSLISYLVAPILEGEADYAKGNRFYSVETVRSMPRLRVVGNAGVSFLSKLSSGYWQLFDATNGFTAIHARVAEALPLHKLHKRYFFESDMLFRLYTLRAVVVELPMPAAYGPENSHLSIPQTLLVFPWLHLRNAAKRIIYTYFLRNFSIASVNLAVGWLLVLFGTAFGAAAWIESTTTGDPATAGTVMLSALPLLVGVQLLLSFVSYDITMVPTTPIQSRIRLALDWENDARAENL